MSIKVRDILAKLKIEAKECRALDTEVHYNIDGNGDGSPAEKAWLMILDDHGRYHDHDEVYFLGALGEPFEEVIVLE